MKKESKLFFSCLFFANLLLIPPLHCGAENLSPTERVVPKATTSNFVSTLPKSASSELKGQLLQDGFYLIQREASTRTELQPLIESERILVNDYEFLQENERGKTTYIVVNTGSFIPIILREPPIKEKDDVGKPKLSIALAEDQIQPLEKFTRENVMKNVAIVIGGRVVTMHKIRMPIVGGKIQITRCTDHGCEALYTELEKRDRK